MTTLVVPLPVGLAKELTRIADVYSMSNEDVGRLALQLFCRAVKADERTNQPTNQRKTSAIGGGVAALSSCDLFWREDPLPSGGES